MSVAAVVLAAGASRRLGYPKQDVAIDGETLLQRTVRLAHEASLSPTIVVARSGTDYGKTLQSGSPILIAMNPEADEGIASSIRCGIALASNRQVAGAVILACDQPLLHVDHLRSLVEDTDRVTGSAYAGSIGVPAYFPATYFHLLQQLRGDTGARKLLVNAHLITAEDLKLDIDTEQDLAAAQARFEHDSTKPL